jgi:DNA-binding MarR family transcriptional regulator
MIIVTDSIAVVSEQAREQPADPPAVLSATGYLLMKAGVLIGRTFDEVLDSCGLTARQFLLMSVVCESKSESQLEVSRHLHLDPTIVVGVVDDLEANGLITRQRHPDDRRRSVLALTPAGIKLLRKATARTVAAEESFLAALTPAEQESFRAALARVVVPKLDQL